MDDRLRAFLARVDPRSGRHGLVRLGVASCVALAVVLGVVYGIRAVDRLGDGAEVNAAENYDDREFGGGNSIVNANAWDASGPGYEVTAGPSMRMVIDLGDLDRSVWVNATGQSGHPYNAHYSDQIDAWVANEPFPWPFGTEAVAAAADTELTLVPPGQVPNG